MRSQQWQVWRVKRCARCDFGRIKYVPCDEARGESLRRVVEKVVAEVPKFFKTRVSTREIASISVTPWRKSNPITFCAGQPSATAFRKSFPT
jgi:hypothetical protein